LADYRAFALQVFPVMRHRYRFLSRALLLLCYMHILQRTADAGSFRGSCCICVTSISCNAPPIPAPVAAPILKGTDSCARGAGTGHTLI
jgi:hypothetical protein